LQEDVGYLPEAEDVFQSAWTYLMDGNRQKLYELCQERKISKQLFTLLHHISSALNGKQKDMPTPSKNNKQG
jgi:hypothetical protein